MLDTHAHIDADAFEEDRDIMLERAWSAGLEAIVIPAISPDRFENVRRLVASHQRLFNGAGIHPHHAHESSPEHLQSIEEWCTQQKTVAVGEIGLDYHYDFCSPEIQQRVFRAQLQIAKRTGKPVIVHNRESDEDVLRIIEEEQDGSLRGVLHCFSSGEEILRRAIDLGFHVSFTGNITFKRSTLDAVARAVPEGRYMIETDSPYITPVPHRGHRNEPSYVGLVASKLAEIRTMTVADVVLSTTLTARKFFGLAVLILVMTATLYSQPARPIDADYPTDDALDRAWVAYELDSIAWARYIKPRVIGVGLTLGLTTVVETQQRTEQFLRKTHTPPVLPNRWVSHGDSGASVPISYDGLAAFGGTIMVGVTDHLSVEATYTYTRNNKPFELFRIDPVITQVYEFAALYTLNPYGRINFILSGGASMGVRDDGITTSLKFGPNIGFGAGFAIPTSFGLFYPVVDVRFNFMLGSDRNRIVRRWDALPDDDPRYVTTDGLVFNPLDPTQVSVDRANVVTLYSIPRFTLMWYPPF